MSEKVNRTTGIEWTHHTWNYFVGCTVHTAGCTNCYAMRQAHRLEHNFGMKAYTGTTKQVNGKPVWTGRVNLSSERQRRMPYRIAQPSLIFVNSMSDVFHAAVPDEWRNAMFSDMRALPRHTFQILTKRPENAVEYFKRHPANADLPNVWLGATVEDGRVLHRIDLLRQIPVKTRFISAEPLIGSWGEADLTGIHWVITGGESGPGARLCNPQWVREIRDMCMAQGVSLFHKQWGMYHSNPLCFEQRMPVGEAEAQDPHVNGKGGGLLDGRLWREFPAGSATEASCDSLLSL